MHWCISQSSKCDMPLICWGWQLTGLYFYVSDPLVTLVKHIYACILLHAQIEHTHNKTHTGANAAQQWMLLGGEKVTDCLIFLSEEF